VWITGLSAIKNAGITMKTAINEVVTIRAIIIYAAASLK